MRSAWRDVPVLTLRQAQGEESFKVTWSDRRQREVNKRHTEPQSLSQVSVMLNSVVSVAEVTPSDTTHCHVSSKLSVPAPPSVSDAVSVSVAVPVPLALMPDGAETRDHE